MCRVPRRLLLPAIMSCLLAAILALAGCGRSGVPTAAARPTSTPSATATPLPTVVVPSIATWATYTDSTYHFKAVIPPGWRIGTYLDTRADVGGDCEYVAVYFPPGDTNQPHPLVNMEMHEFMLIEVTLKCHSWSPADNQYVTPAGGVTISGTATTMYANDSSEQVHRIAFAPFGGHQFTFILLGASQPTANQRTAITADIPLYLGMLSGFQYLGA